MNLRYHTVWLLCFSLLVFMILSCSSPKPKVVLPSVTSDDPLPLGTYDFSFDKGPFSSNLDTLVQLGYKGIVLSIYDSGSQKNIDNILKFKTVSPEFKLYAAFMRYDLDKPQH